VALLDEVLSANAAVLQGSDVPIPAVPADRRVVVVTCGEIRAPNGRDLASYFGFAPDEAFVVANAGARVERPDGDVARSVAEALARAGGGEVFVVAHEGCDFLDADPEGVAALAPSPGSALLQAAERLCGESFVSARKLAIASAETLRASPFLGARVPVHAMVFDEGRARLSAEQPGYGLVGAAGVAPAPAGLGPGPSPILGAPGPVASGGYTAGPVSLAGAGPSALMGAPPPLVAPPPDLGAGASSLMAPPPPPMPVAPVMPVMPAMPAPAPPPMPSVAPPPPPARSAAPPPLESISFSEPPPPPPPPRKPPPRGPAPPPDADDPFRRAAEVLERLRRERRK
jgi:carbonic anhydrase